MPEAEPLPRLIYAASENCADLLYLSGLAAPDPFLWFQTPAGSAMVVSALEVSRAVKQGRAGVEVIPAGELQHRLGLRRPVAGGAAAQIVAVSRALGVKAWAVPGDFPLGLAREVQRHRIRLVPTLPFCPERLCKGAAEIAAIRAGVALAAAGLERACQILRQSAIGTDGWLHWQGTPLLAETLRGEINAEVARCGGSAAGTIAAPGVQGADPHQAGSGPIPAHAPIVLDIFPRHHDSGYYGDLTRTVVRGKASDAVWRAFTCVRDAQAKALSALRAGVTGAAVHELVEAHFSAAGYETELGGLAPRGFIHSTGHGLGLAVHEAPALSRRQTTPLQAGQVVTVEPGLYYPEWGGVRIEDVAVIRTDGSENLTGLPVFLEI